MRHSIRHFVHGLSVDKWVLIISDVRVAVSKTVILNFSATVIARLYCNIVTMATWLQQRYCACLVSGCQVHGNGVLWYQITCHRGNNTGNVVLLPLQTHILITTFTYVITMFPLPCLLSSICHCYYYRYYYYLF